MCVDSCKAVKCKKSSENDLFWTDFPFPGDIAILGMRDEVPLWHGLCTNMQIVRYLLFDIVGVKNKSFYLYL